MRSPMFSKLVLTLSGLVAIAVGLGVLFAPRAFHATAGLTISDDPLLLNEIRAPGGMVLICGLIFLAGAARARLATPALAASTALYLSFGASRAVSVALDGVPNAAFLQIMTLELIIGAVCAAMLAIETRRPSGLAA